MLRRNSSDSTMLPRKGVDVIMKHKIRNLRAKLKNLLSSDSCTKYSKRTKQVRKIQQLENKHFQMTNTFFNINKNLFTHTKEQPKHLWYSEKQKCNVMHVFGKLTKDEVQQIQQDMIYYLGEDHIQKFKEFLEIKNGNKQNLNGARRLKTSNKNILSTQRNIRASYQHQTQRKQSNISNLPRFMKNCSINDNFFAIRPSDQSDQTYQDRSSKRLKTINLIESRASSVTRRSAQKQRIKFQANYLGNRQNFLKNRRMIEEQQNAQRFLTKVNLQMKQEKAIDIFKTTQDAFVSTIKEKNTNNDFKTKKILQEKYKKNVTFGSIVELNEELRKIYIKKISENTTGGGLAQIPQQKILDKKKYDTTLSNFFPSTNSHYRSKY